MGVRALVIVGLVGVAGWYVYENRESLGLSNLLDSSGLDTGVEDLESATLGWASVGEGPTWVPVINQVENNLGLPSNLLARMAYEESRFRTDIITGSTSSSAGAQGILQLMPSSFPNLDFNPPYSSQDTSDQISAAGQYLVTLFNEFQDWSRAVGAYNAGPGTMSSAIAGTTTLPQETITYVNQIFADVPVAAVDIPA